MRDANPESNTVCWLYADTNAATNTDADRDANAVCWLYADTDPSVHLLHVGEGPELAMLKQHASSLGMAKYRR